MGWWIELRCDVNLAHDCYSNLNNGPMGMAKNTYRNASKLITRLNAEAQAHGWRRLGQHRLMHCPSCAREAFLVAHEVRFDELKP